MIKIQRGSDPFKKYWWVLLVVFGGGGLGVCLPGLSGGDGAGGSAGAAAAGDEGLRTVDGSSASLDPVNNPSGAPGGAINLSMEGAGRKSGLGADGGGLMSSLYEAPQDQTSESAAAASGAAAGTASATAAPGGGKRALADALRDISRKKSASADASGWGGQKAQRGFTAPKGNFGGLSGLGGGSSASGARLNAGGGAAGGGFGSSAEQRVGVSTARGLKDDGLGDGSTQVRSFNNLKAVNRAMNNAARGDMGSALAFSGRAFDGGGAGGRISMTAGQAADSVGASLTAAPMNLKVNDPDANSFKFEPVPMTEAPNMGDQQARMKQMMMMAVVMGVIGLATGGGAMAMAGPVMMMMMQQGQQQQAQSQQNAQQTCGRFNNC